MDRLLTIVMYHYVRDMEHSRFPDIKGLTVTQFKEQIAYIKANYNVISGQKLLDVIGANDRLPARPLLLTFDDGYIDHFTNVFPILYHEELSGCFFPSAKAISEHTVIDVNKIHLILSSIQDKSELVDFILKMIADFQHEFDLKDSSYYWENFVEDSRYDSMEVLFVKRMLQRDLPETLRSIIIDALFRKYVNSDEKLIANELYMSLDQLKCMHEHGMYIGSHGYNHRWLNCIDKEMQEYEVDKSLDMMESIKGSKINNWIISYPYGAYNDSLLEVLSARGCTLGLTTGVALADLNKHNRLMLPRIDTNDLPKDGSAEINEWTKMVFSDSPLHAEAREA